jgi:hypothetical protein
MNTTPGDLVNWYQRHRQVTEDDSADGTESTAPDVKKRPPPE